MCCAAEPMAFPQIVQAHLCTHVQPTVGPMTLSDAAHVGQYGCEGLAYASVVADVLVSLVRFFGLICSLLSSTFS